MLLKKGGLFLNVSTCLSLSISISLLTFFCIFFAKLVTLQREKTDTSNFLSISVMFSLTPSVQQITVNHQFCNLVSSATWNCGYVSGVVGLNAVSHLQSSAGEIEKPALPSVPRHSKMHRGGKQKTQCSEVSIGYVFFTERGCTLCPFQGKKWSFQPKVFIAQRLHSYKVLYSISVRDALWTFGIWQIAYNLDGFRVKCETFPDWRNIREFKFQLMVDDIIMGVTIVHQSRASKQLFFLSVLFPVIFFLFFATFYTFFLSVFLLHYLCPQNVSFIHHLCCMIPLIQWALTSGPGHQSALVPFSVAVWKVNVSSLPSALCHLSCLYISIMGEVEMSLGADHTVLPHVHADLHKILTSVHCDLSVWNQRLKNGGGSCCSLQARESETNPV